MLKVGSLGGAPLTNQPTQKSVRCFLGAEINLDYCFAINNGTFSLIVSPSYGHFNLRGKNNQITAAFLSFLVPERGKI